MVFILMFYIRTRGQEAKGAETLTNLPSVHCFDYIKISQEKPHTFIL